MSTAWEYNIKLYHIAILKGIVQGSGQKGKYRENQTFVKTFLPPITLKKQII